MKHLTSNEIRNMWLDFFKGKGHKVEKGASLIPHNDPTLLWINSGVAALKKYFDGSEIPPSRRITNVQKSIRTNDIENVGHTARHHTFFEMLGNFSIGDYFRKEVIAWAYEILMSPQWFDFDKDKIYVTYYPSDLETKKLWIEQGLDENHLIPLEGNFWQIGEGPCGPNTEVFYDRGEKYDPNHLGIKMLQQDMENDRYIEIWGIVFSQYNAINGVDRKNYKELPSRNIDTGSGLERICCIMQEADTNFDTDLFLPIIHKTEKLALHKYEGEYKASYRVIADHIRACTFALSDGENFSNEGRGYVLRRLIRRAMRYGQKIGINEPFMYKLVSTVIDVMKSYYPELVANQTRIEKTIKAEEEKFLKTLQNGEQILLKLIEHSNLLLGKDAFKLYDTFGFPIDLTKEICQEHGVQIDIDGFEKEMEKQKQQARQARNGLESMNRQSKDLLDFKCESNFTYGDEPIQGTVIGLFINGEKVDSIKDKGEVIFDTTNFYAESGGQIADIGTISNDSCSLKVNNVIKAPNKQHLHSVEVLYGEVKVGDKFNLSIEQTRRYKIMRNHSATHLLQAALDIILNSEINQAGSQVNEDYVHFDFNYDGKISDEELYQIEKQVNLWICQAIPSHTDVLPIDQAKKIGAKALFDEKYGDMVRVVCFGDISKEFCGGTHVKNTSDIGVFYIISESSIASGVRRIQFATSYGAYEEIKRRENILNQAKEKINAKSYKEIGDRLNSIIAEKDELKKQNDALNKKIANVMSESLKEQFSMVNGHYIVCSYLGNISKDILLHIVDNLKTCYEDYAIVLIANDGKSIPVCVALGKEAIKDGLKAGQIVSEACKVLNGSGGGRLDFAMGAGKDNSKINDALDLVKGILSK